MRATAGRIARWWRGLPQGTRTALSALGLLGLAILVWTWYYCRHRLIAITDPDAEDYAQIALQCFKGRGWTSRTMPLCGLEWLRQTGGNPAGGATWPNLHRFPFMSYVMWALYHLPCCNPARTDLALGLSSGIFYVLSVPLVCLLGRRVFSDAVGVVGAVLYLFSPLSLGASIGGLTEQATTCFMLLVLILISGRPGRPALALAGILWGIAFWNRYTVVMLIPPFAVYLWVQDRKRAWGNIAVFAVAAALGMAPEVLRNLRLAGDPMFSLTAALMAPYKSSIAPRVHWWYIPVYVKPTELLLAWPAEMWEKWRAEFTTGWRQLPFLTGQEALYPFLLLSLFLRAETPVQRNLRRLTLALIALHMLTLPFLSNIVRYYAYLSPLLALYATWGIQVIARRLWPLFWPADASHLAGPRLFGRTLPATVALAALGAPLVMGWITATGPRPTMNLGSALIDNSRRHMTAVREMVGDDEVVICNSPWSIALWADRKSIPLPPGPALVPDLIRDYGLNVRAIFLTPRPVAFWESASYRSWEALRYGARRVPGFRVAKRFQDGAVLFVKDYQGPEPPAISPLAGP